MTIQKALVTDSNILTEITKKSKAHWGYSDEQLELWVESLTISEIYISINSVYKLLINNQTVGYYSFSYKNTPVIELDNLFITPEFIGKGFGRVLMNDFLTNAKRMGATKIILDSEPNAEVFYAKLGFITVGQVETSIKNRYMPRMELRIEAQ